MSCASAPAERVEIPRDLQRIQFPHSDRTLSSFTAVSQNAMVSTEGEPASRIGLDILQRGGNAVDAAVAISIAIGVHRPQSTGIGGGGFMLVYLSDQDTFVAIDMREAAPLAASKEMYLKDGEPVPGLSVNGGLAVGVPGLVDGLYLAYSRYGSGNISWNDLVDPSAQLARRGFSIYPHLARAIKVLEKRGALDRYFETRQLLSHMDGTLLQEGDLYRNPGLADTLDSIASKGVEGFSKGWVADEIVSANRAAGGILTGEDLFTYRAVIREPVYGNYHGQEIVGFPPPSSGGILIVEMLNMLEVMNYGILPFNSADAIHLKAEVMRRAYADRAEHIGDPDHYRVPTAHLTSKEFARQRAKDIDLYHASQSQKEIKPALLPGYLASSTTHFSIVDKDGNAVASTQSINHYFGSGVLAGKSGIFLNNEMDDFSIQPGVPNAFGLIGGEANSIAPGKRPLSSMSPTMIRKDGKLDMVLGSPGGSLIITAVMNVILNRIDHRMTLSEAIFAPRIHHQWLPDKLRVEANGFTSETIKALKIRGHKVEERNRLIGNVTAVAISPTDRSLTGTADPRGIGKPIGY